MSRMLFILSIVLKFLDVCATAYIVGRHGVSAEANPIIRSMFSAYGVCLTLALILVIFTALMFVLYKFEQKSLLLMAVIAMLIVVINNVVGVFS